MSELFIYTIILAVWLILQIWVLPKLGVPTCLSGSCAAPIRQRPKGLSKKDSNPEEEEA